MLTRLRTKRAARDAVDEWVDAVELWAEDGDVWAEDNLHEMTRFVIDDVPRKALLRALAR